MYYQKERNMGTVTCDSQLANQLVFNNLAAGITVFSTKHLAGVPI